MRAIQQREAFIVVPPGRKVPDFLKGEVSILWTQEDLNTHLETMMFHSDEFNKPQVIPITVGIPFEVDDGYFEQPVARQERRVNLLVRNNA